ncbi:zinc finger A20 and AN1 domain-containing stress-associated protein 5 [Typha latifolia]|uniref:zinc finger A20 and AN1 domain-containing stress-associated protein 5 n=1 Tax=Typha latifolia TaxID=4733 RepID=UPI003C2BA842
MAEEQRCQEGHRLCANNCGVFGSPTTLNLCSKCYRDLRIKEEQNASAKIAFDKSLSSSSSTSSPFLQSPSAVAVAEPEPSRSVSIPTTATAAPGRCAACKRRVRLMGFTCRCGATCCGTHRYPERHDCSFDFKAAGRAEIARANPAVKAEKLLDKI